jgi:hypothetical protein
MLTGEAGPSQRPKRRSMVRILTNSAALGAMIVLGAVAFSYWALKESQSNPARFTWKIERTWQEDFTDYEESSALRGLVRSTTEQTMTAEYREFAYFLSTTPGLSDAGRPHDGRLDTSLFPRTPEPVSAIGANQGPDHWSVTRLSAGPRLAILSVERRELPRSATEQWRVHWFAMFGVWIALTCIGVAAASASSKVCRALRRGRCRGCGYAIHELRKCPECGEDVPSTVRRRAARAGPEEA